VFFDVVQRLSQEKVQKVEDIISTYSNRNLGARGPLHAVITYDRGDNLETKDSFLLPADSEGVHWIADDNRSLPSSYYRSLVPDWYDGMRYILELD